MLSLLRLRTTHLGIFFGFLHSNCVRLILSLCFFFFNRLDAKNRTTLLFDILMFYVQNPYMEFALYLYIHRWRKGTVVVRITTNFYIRPRHIDIPRLWRGPNISVPLAHHYRCASVLTSYFSILLPNFKRLYTYNITHIYSIFFNCF